MYDKVSHDVERDDALFAWQSDDPRLSCRAMGDAGSVGRWDCDGDSRACVGLFWDPGMVICGAALEAIARLAAASNLLSTARAYEAVCR